MIGQLITSFLQGKASPITTSITCNQCAEHATVENKTGLCKGSHGSTPDSNRGGVQSVWVAKWGAMTKTVGVVMGTAARVANDLLPYSWRPIKGRRRRIRGGYGVRAEIYTFRRVWHSHHKPKLIRKLKSLIL